MARVSPQENRRLDPRRRGWTLGRWGEGAAPPPSPGQTGRGAARGARLAWPMQARMASAAAPLGQWQSAALHLPRPANPRGRRRQAAPAGLSNQRQVCCHVNLGLDTAAAAAQTIAAPATRHAAQSALRSASFSRPCPPRAAPLRLRSSQQTLLTAFQRSRRGPARLRGTGDHRCSEVSSAVGGGGRCGQRLRPSGPGLAGALHSAPRGEPRWGRGSGRGSESGIGVRVWDPSSDRSSTSGIRRVLPSRASESVGGSVWGSGFLVLGPISCLESASGLSRGSDGQRPWPGGRSRGPPPHQGCWCGARGRTRVWRPPRASRSWFRGGDRSLGCSPPRGFESGWESRIRARVWNPSWIEFRVGSLSRASASWF